MYGSYEAKYNLHRMMLFIAPEMIIRFDDGAPFGPPITPEDHYMRWTMDRRRFKKTNKYRRKNTKVVYELMVSDGW